MKYPGCQNGVCEQPWECKCAPGWSGMLCDVPELKATLAESNPPPIPDSLPQDATNGGGGSLNAAAMAAQGLSQEQLESITSNAEQQLQLEKGPVNVDMNSFFGDDAVPRYDRDIDIKQEISDLSQPEPEVSQAEEKQTDEHDEMNGDGSNLTPFGSDITKE